MSPCRFAVLKAGRGTAFTEETYGGFGKMAENILRDDGEEWLEFSVVDGDFSFEEKIDEFDGYVITGSPADAHAEEDWIVKLCEILRVLNKKKKVLGICFGHQVLFKAIQTLLIFLAQEICSVRENVQFASSNFQSTSNIKKLVLARALGGKTGRSPENIAWEIGVKQLHLHSKMVSDLYSVGLPSTDLILNVLESHRDQVSHAPPDAVILGHSKNTPIEMFAVGNHTLGVQFHPEFFKDVVLNIIHTSLAANAFCVETANEAIRSLEENRPDSELITELCKAFLKGPR